MRMSDQVIYQLTADEMRDAALVAAGCVAEADNPTPQEVAELRELLDALGIAW